jgi:diaminopimelate decarboxylase
MDFSRLDTPFYLYDTDLLRQTLRQLTAAADRHGNIHIHYAVKANANPKVLRVIRESGIGIDCVSGGEIQAALDAGFPASSIVFAGVGKSDREIRLGLHHDIFCFNVESIPELEVINELAGEMGRTANVCLRINPNVDAHTHANITTGLAENKFGIALEDMERLIALARQLDHIRWRGLHFHVGSQITDMSVFSTLSDRINEIQDRLDAAGLHMDIINVGGGLGIDYDDPAGHPIPDFDAYFAAYAQHLRLRKGQEVHVELGRSIVGQCGSLITRVLYVKQGAVKQFAICDAGMTDLIRPALYDAHHHIDNITATGAVLLSDAPAAVGRMERYDVVGPICESSDVFDKDVLLPVVRRGDILALRSAGAYGEIMASRYNCRPFALPYTTDELRKEC